MDKKSSLSRRSFVRSAAAIGMGISIMKSNGVMGSEKNSAMAVGLIGCGGRGNHDAENFCKFASGRIAVLADPFQDRLESTKKAFEADSPTLYQGMDAYQKLLQSEIDAVIITSPPYFHPEHFAAVVEAKKHVYMEKPVSIDTAGAQEVLQAGKKGDGQITMMVGFQSRYHPELQEAVKRVHAGAIGSVVCGDAFYHSGKLSPQSRPGMSAKEIRLRDWLFDKVLSGDILVEQNIHVIDVCNWFLDAHPIQVFAKGGRKARTFVGDTWDHYEVIYEYPNECEIVFSSTQFLDLGWGDAGERLNGSKGAFDGLSKPIRIRGENPWTPSQESVKKDEAFFQSNDAEANKVRAFYQSVVDKKYINEIPNGVQSTLTSILGRTSAYRKKVVTWKEMIDENEKLDAKL
jgi:predicted dehydrogenase